ncbi:Vesicle-associated protein 2-2 [Citrus sinensis]|uniref:vesicle-associated protein 2-2 isoform X1 n=1 Tax=Citrus sinensis TaxID=2711 RepID=UPI00219967BB|nr:vesicle-associated protein 2-2 isoform X1 [Citrus sinensis]XP_006471803.2 vesicle-associated protein 2-2 isoform X1 [Citrus sinensis]KAH9688464.1 Vesicle-associated protein 2-2 [Citrus sinensis]
MNKQLLEIQPKELKFIFELKKQSSCSVRLTNNTHHYIAFKVKTTSPKKYCVRPNVGIILPKSTCDFNVTMQAQAVAPPDMVCKDKFLIQSTVVPVGTTDEDITASMFAKDDGRYIQENKLRVILISPPNSPVLSPINGVLKQGPTYESSSLKDPVFSKFEILTPPHTVSKNVEGSKLVNAEKLKPDKVEELKPREDFFSGEVLKSAKDTEVKLRKDVVDSQELTPTVNADLNPRKDVADGEELKSSKDTELKPREDIIRGEELTSTKDAELELRKDVISSEELTSTEDPELKPRKDEANSVELKEEKVIELNLPKEVVNGEELQPKKDAELKLMKELEFKAGKAAEELELVKDIEEMKSKLNELQSKLSEAEVTISKLTEENRLGIQEKKILKGELDTLRSKSVVKNVHVGFPLLFVCMVALISFVLGRLIL